MVNTANRDVRAAAAALARATRAGGDVDMARQVLRRQVLYAAIQRALDAHPGPLTEAERDHIARMLEN